MKPMKNPARKDMRVAILCGGRGHRFREFTDAAPKPLIPIGGRPILWHIMRYYEDFGFRRFVLCLGYMGNEIRTYFTGENARGWDITFADTGLDTHTGGRIKKIEKHIHEDVFLATYGDGLADIDLGALLEFHRRKGRIATLTSVRPHSPFGLVHIDAESLVSSFEEKPVLDHWINGGFFVFNRRIFDYIEENDVLEKKPFVRLAQEKELAAFKFKGFWKCMDTYKDHLELNDLWTRGQSPWARWLKKEKP
jgi:glucose-1-phosphate cytidylyltransferase